MSKLTWTRLWVLALCCAMCGFGQDFSVGFRYDREHVLFYSVTMRDPTGGKERPLAGRNFVNYGAGGYLLPLTRERLQTMQAVTGSAGDVPMLGAVFTVLLGGEAKVRANAEQYVEQWGMENPVVLVGVLARIGRTDEVRFRQAPVSAFLIQPPSGARLPATTDSAPCSRCEKKVLNRFKGVGELMLERFDAGWSVTLYRNTAEGLRKTKVMYSYGD